MLLRYYHLLRTGAPLVLSLLRVVAALVLLEHGTQKMFDFPPMPRFGFPGAGGPAQAGAPNAQTPRSAAATAADGAAVAATSAAAAGPTGAPTVATPAPGPNAATPAPAGNGGPRAAGAGPPGGGGRGPGGGGPPYPLWLMPIAGWIETVAGALLVIGLFSRSAAFLLSGETAVVYFIAHLPLGPYPISNGGEAAVLFSWTFLYIFFAGPGPISIDALWKRARGRFGTVRAGTTAAE